MAIKRLALLSLSLFVSSCTAFSSFPSCPTDDVYEFLSCSEPELILRDDYRRYADMLISVCAEAPAEWLPALDSNVRSTVPDVRDFIKSVPKIDDLYVYHSVEIRTLGNQELYQSVLGFFIEPLLHFASVRMRSSTDENCSRDKNKFCLLPSHLNCIEIFEHLGDGRQIEVMKEREEERILEQWSR